MVAKTEIKRTIEIEEFTNRYVIHPISGYLVPLFHRLDIHPNTVSLAGAFSGAIAAACYFNYENTAATVAGFLFMAGWHVMDGADGQLARLSGKVTASGYIIDGLCDYTTFILVYAALALRLTEIYGMWIWSIVVLSGLSHVAQAAAFELQRTYYNRWVSGKAFAAAALGDGAPCTAAAPLSGLGWIYERVQQPFRPTDDDLAQQLADYGGMNAGRGAHVSQFYRETFRDTVLRWSWLSANNHTTAIFVACYFKSPLAYFMFEIVVFNALLALLVRQNRAQAVRLHDWLVINSRSEAAERVP